MVYSKEEVVTVIKHARDEHLKIRMLGSGHSWSPVATSDGLIMSLYHYHGLVSHDLKKNQVTLRGGTILAEMNAILDGLGLALSNLPSISAQTIAGTIATGMCTCYYCISCIVTVCVVLVSLIRCGLVKI